MASLLASLLEEEARQACPPPSKKARRAADFPLAFNSTAEDSVKIDVSAELFNTSPPSPPESGDAYTCGGSVRGPGPGQSQSRPRTARRLFSNLSMADGNPFTEELAKREAPKSEEASTVYRDPRYEGCEEGCKNNCKVLKHRKRKEICKNTSEEGSGVGDKVHSQAQRRGENCIVSYPSGNQGKDSAKGLIKTADQGSSHQRPHQQKRGNPEFPSGGVSFENLRERLPVWEYRDQLRQSVKERQVTLVIGETGSGKTTQIPQLLLHWGLGSGGWIAVSQPRRVAAVSLARRVSAEMGEVEVGGLVGYSVRFESKLSRRTRICYMTDGMMVREALLDSTLKRFSVLILDEVHERTLQTDFLLGMAKCLTDRRPELKILLMSATMETEKLKRFFPEASIVCIPGSTFPLKTLYVRDPQEDFLEAAMLAVLKIHLGDAGGGDVLVFLPGQEEIETLAVMLQSKLQLLETFAAKHKQKYGDGVEFSVRLGDEVYRHKKLQRLLICPLYASMPFDRQQQVLLPAPPQYSRKAVLATNIAETSLTVSGIRFVVDTGLCKAKARDHCTLTEALLLQEISQDSAKQRGGRAGREAPGTVFCLYTEDCFNKMQAHKTPEILSCDLSQLFLHLKGSRTVAKDTNVAASTTAVGKFWLLQVLGVKNPLDFPMLDMPPRDAFSSAGRNLYRLEAIDDQGIITSLGKQLAALPLPPQLGALLLAATALDCEEAALTLTAMLSAENVWSTPFNLSRGAATALSKARRRFTDPLSDHLTLVGAYNHWAQADDPYSFCKEAGLQHSAMLRARAIRQQLQDVLATLGGRATRFTSEPATSREDAQSQQQALNLRRCLAKSCWQQAARLQPETRQFVTAVHRQTAKIHPTSVLSSCVQLPQWVIYTELVHTSKSYMRCVTAIEAPWLRELAPKWFTTLRS